MKLQVYTTDEMFQLAVAIVRTVTGVEYPFTKGTWHRALAQVQALFAANANKETLRLARGDNVGSLRGPLLDRRVLESNVMRIPKAGARVSGRFQRSGATGVAAAIPPDTVVLRAATGTQSEIAFKTESAATIGASDTQSNLVFATCMEIGTKGNAIPSGATLALRNPMTKVASFLTVSQAYGGRDKESAESLITRYRNTRKGHGLVTWAGIENKLYDIELDSGQRITSAKVFESFEDTAPFYLGRVYAIIDDGSGDHTVVGPEEVTYKYGGSDYWTFESTGYDIYLRTDHHMVPWDDLTNASLEVDTGGGYAFLTEGTDFWVNPDTGIVALNTPLTTGHIARLQFTYYGALVHEAALRINGEYHSTTNKGWKPAGYSVRIRGPQSLTTPTVTGNLIFSGDWDSTFGRTLASTNILAYLNSLDISEAARYDVITGLVHATPGLTRVNNLLLNSALIDLAPGNIYGVIRGDVTKVVF